MEAQIAGIVNDNPQNEVKTDIKQPVKFVPTDAHEFAQYGKVIKRTLLKNGYFSVQLQIRHKDGRIFTKTISSCHYSWLKNNPAFEGIPKGYVIHHLDGDSFNDDPTNLVLMERNFHWAYHRKNIKREPQVVSEILPKNMSKNLTVEGRPLPVSKPTIYKRPDTQVDRWILRYNVKGENIAMSSYKGRKFETRQDAEWAMAEIWKPPPETAPCPTCEGRGYII